MTLSVDADIQAGEDLLGKSVTNLQSGVAIDGSHVTGSLKYVTGYTAFSGEPELQSGHYLALHAECDDADSITVEVINGTVGHPVTLDDDGLAILRIADKDAQSIEFVATKDGVKRSKKLLLSDLVLEEEA